MYAINLNINQNRLNYNAELFGDAQSAYILQPLHAYHPQEHTGTLVAFGLRIDGGPLLYACWGAKDSRYLTTQASTHAWIHRGNRGSGPHPWKITSSYMYT